MDIHLLRVLFIISWLVMYVSDSVFNLVNMLETAECRLAGSPHSHTEANAILIRLKHHDTVFYLCARNQHQTHN